MQALHAGRVSLLVAKILLLSDAVGNQTLGQSAILLNNHLDIRGLLLQLSHLREGGREGEGGREREGGREGGRGRQREGGRAREGGREGREEEIFKLTALYTRQRPSSIYQPSFKAAQMTGLNHTHTRTHTYIQTLEFPSVSIPCRSLLSLLIVSEQALN